MATVRRPREPEPDERLAIVETKVEALTAAHKELAQLLREHMKLEDATTQAVMANLASIEKRLSGWRGLAIGGALVVSAALNFAMVVAAWLR